MNEEPELNVRGSGAAEQDRARAGLPDDGDPGEPQGLEPQGLEPQGLEPQGLEPQRSPGAPVPDAGDEDRPEVDELVEVTRQRDEYLDALQRLKAEFDNYRKRVAREQQVVVVRAAERLIKQLIPMLDDLERAVEAAVEHGELKLEDGVRLVHRSLANTLASEGLVEVDTDGPFDPHTQEALLAQPSEQAEGTVIEVLQKGYKLGDHVLRPARVVVSSGPPAAGPGRAEL